MQTSRWLCWALTFCFVCTAVLLLKAWSLVARLPLKKHIED